MFDLTTYVKKWRIRQLKTVFSTLDTLCSGRGCKKSIGQIKSLLGLQFHRKRQISPPSCMNIVAHWHFFTQVSNNSLNRALKLKSALYVTDRIDSNLGKQLWLVCHKPSILGKAVIGRLFSVPDLGLCDRPMRALPKIEQLYKSIQSNESFVQNWAIT